MLEGEIGDEGGSARNDKNDYDAAAGRACKGEEMELRGEMWGEFGAKREI